MDLTKDALQFLRSHSVVSVVQHEIERMILSGELPPGSRLNELSLANKLDVSRSPVREACRKLEQAGVLKIVNNKGVFVRELDIEQALDILEIRAALAPMLGRKLAANVTDEQLAKLASLVARMDRAACNNDVDSYYPLNMEFHGLLLAFSGSTRLTSVFQGMEMELHLFRQRVLVTSGLEESNQEHKEILTALEARDPDTAARAMSKHLGRTRRRMLSARETARKVAPERT